MPRSSVQINSAEMATHFYSSYDCCSVLFIATMLILNHEYMRFILTTRYGRKSLYSTVRLVKHSMFVIFSYVVCKLNFTDPFSCWI